MRKIPFLDHFLPFSPKIGTMGIFYKNRAPSDFSSPKILYSCKKSEKTNETILRKSVNRKTDRPERGDFIGPSRYARVKKCHY